MKAKLWKRGGSREKETQNYGTRHRRRREAAEGEKTKRKEN